MRGGGNPFKYIYVLKVAKSCTSLQHTFKCILVGKGYNYNNLTLHHVKNHKPLGFKWHPCLTAQLKVSGFPITSTHSQAGVRNDERTCGLFSVPSTSVTIGHWVVSGLPVFVCIVPEADINMKV